MPFIAESNTMKTTKDSKKRKANAISEQLIVNSLTFSDSEMPDLEAPPKSKKKSSKKEKRTKDTVGDAVEIEVEAEIEVEPEVEVEADVEVESEQGDNEENQSIEAPPSKKRKSAVDEIEVDITLPEPPSKKALRRLKKGKPLPPSKSGAEPSPEPEAKKEVEKRSGHGVWVGNMPWSVSKVELCKWLVEMSDLTEENITRVHMPGPNDNKPANKVEKKFGKPVHNKGFAYVDFQSEDHVKMAVELSEQLLTGRRLLIKDSKSFEGRPAKEEARIDGKPPSKKVFVGNLRFDATKESLMEHFAPCGTIEHVHVATFEDSGKCKGYAWIRFEDIEAGQNAVKGYLYVDEEVSDDSESDSDSDSDDSDAESKNDSEKDDVKPKRAKKTMKRKVWVNRIQGRPLRVEFAEDDQIRYKKRYGKDGTKNKANDGAAGESFGAEPVVEKRVLPIKKVEYRQSYAPRLTGGIVESKGKKTTF